MSILNTSIRKMAEILVVNFKERKILQFVQVVQDAFTLLENYIEYFTNKCITQYEDRDRLFFTIQLFRNHIIHWLQKLFIQQSSLTYIYYCARKDGYRDVRFSSI